MDKKKILDNFWGSKMGGSGGGGEWGLYTKSKRHFQILIFQNKKDGKYSKTYNISINFYNIYI